MKNCISGYFRHISSIFSGKKMIWLRHVLGISNTHLWAKTEKKLMMKSRENTQKPVFPAYFRHFQPEKKVFTKSGSVTFWALPFRISVQNFMKKYKAQLEKFKKCHFSGENRLFRGSLESSGNKNQLYWKFNQCLMVDVVIDNVSVKKQRNKRK